MCQERPSICAMKLLSLIISILITIASVVLCQQIILHSIANQKNKIDYAELNHVNYGLFSVDEWKKHITSILAEEIGKMNMSKATEREIRKQIEALLNTLIDKVVKNIREGNSGSGEGWIRQSFLDMFLKMEDIKKGIPEYADAIMHEMTKAKTMNQIKAMLNKQFERYFSQTFSLQDTAPISRILLRTGSPDIESARSKLSSEISAKQRLILADTLLLIILSVVQFSLARFSRQPLAPARYILLVLSLVLLLAAGVTTPMIDMEAKISRMSVVLMGHTIHFENQVLYFQSKSILDVFWIMITHLDLQMKFVGVLLITFSIVFPLLKIASSLGYYYDYRQARKSPAIGFFVFQAGKWSMADVMVIAIFMSYIGFNGIIASQFDQLSSAAREFEILTTNGTSLQPGYYLFLTYTLLALFSSGFLTRKSPASEPQTP